MNNITDSTNFSSFLKSDLKEKLSPERINSFISDFRQSLPDDKKIELDQFLNATKSPNIRPLGNKGDNGDISPQNALKIGYDFFRQMGNNIILEMVRECLRKVNAPSYVLSCGFYALPKIPGVALVRYINGDGLHNSTVSRIEWNKAHMCHCKNVWLCPSCRRALFGGRCVEINKAFKQWQEYGGSCFLMTLTARHTSQSRLVEMIPLMKVAYEKFRHSRAFKNLWHQVESPLNNASIIGNWEVTFGRGGVHPHRHFLLFAKGDVLKHLDKLKLAWVSACDSVGLVASKKIGLDIELCQTSGNYLAKIGFEMADSSYAKEVRNGSERLNYVQLCYMANNGVSWAIGQLKDYIKGVKGLRALHWSKGLKKRFNIDDIDDDEVIKKRLKIYYAWISSNTAKRLPIDILSAICDTFNICQGNIQDENIKQICDSLKIDMYDGKANLLYNFGGDSLGLQNSIKHQFLLETEGLQYLSNVPINELSLEEDFSAIEEKQIPLEKMEQGELNL